MTIKEVLEVEKSVAQMVQDLKKKIAQAVEQRPLEGVNHIAPNIITLKASSIQHNVWSPEYYIQEAQARNVEQALSSITTASAFVNKVRDIIDQRCVKIGANRFPLNDNTIVVLQEYLEESGAEI